MSETPQSLDLLKELPKIPQQDFTKALVEAKRSSLDAIVVLDDDPTGTQTVHDIPVLTQWTESAIKQEFEQGTPLFYILTNSRSLTQEAAAKLAGEIGVNIRAAAKATGTRFLVISRSDSTLRGHYPAEVTALEKSLGYKEGIHFIVPAFFEGGRYTINDVHYVWQDQELIPSASTPYAQDQVFGYRHSHLKYWVEEKTKGKVTSDQVVSISIEELRGGSPEQLSKKFSALAPGTHCIVNAAAYPDLVFFSLALITSGVQPLLRTAASLVAALACQEDKPLLGRDELVTAHGKGGLVVAGSYVATTTIQLNHLFRNQKDLLILEITVPRLMDEENPLDAGAFSEQIDQGLKQGKTVVLFTSRRLVHHKSVEKNQETSQRVSRFITDIVKGIHTVPGFLITKGGITSSDVATRALGVKRALVKGQIIKGVPVWQLGDKSRFPGLHQIIFPGNVGSEDSLTQVVNKLTIPEDGFDHL